MATDSELVNAAIEAMNKAYAPYSKFHVGAAILDEDGQIHCGANVENAAYPVGHCAEASAISAMIMAGRRRIVKIAVAGGNGEDSLLCTPCGGCRQRIREFAAADVPVLVAGSKGLQARFTIEDLLPESFGPENLDS